MYLGFGGIKLKFTNGNKSMCIGDSKGEILDTLVFNYIPKFVSWKRCGYKISNTMVTKDLLKFISDEPDELLLQGIFYFYYGN